jgi:transcriptional regulator with GAF, ATPase, and Fis domain
MINEDRFVREASLRLCSHVRIEKGPQARVQYLGQPMPADGLDLERFEPELGAMRIAVRATVNAAERFDIPIPFDDQARAAMAQAGEADRVGQLPPVLVFNRPREKPVTRCILAALGVPPSSAMSMPLGVENRMAGALAMVAEGDDRYEEGHIRLYVTLKEPLFVAMCNTLGHGEVVRLRDRLADDNRYLQRELLHLSGDEVVGADFGLREVMHKVRQVGPTESPVLLTGETGVGKDVVASTIHLGSARRDGPFIPVNCGAIPDSLIDSELFGHEKGAFSGALARKRGRFERAHRGTILLDEIGEMPLEAQVRLLRVLQHREIERVGGTERIPVDIRIIAATNKDLPEMVRSGRFREDLWFRLNVFPIDVPPLRERTSDVPALVHHFIQRKARELKLGETPELAPGAIDRLMAYDWPGNVRELENLVERAMILHRGEPLRFDDLGVSIPDQTVPATLAGDMETLELDAVVEGHIRRVLGMTGGKIHGHGGAGELLGVNPNTLRSRMRKLGIPFRRDRR